MSGRRGSAILTRLLTFTVAMSMLVPTSNVAVIVNVPLEAAVELKYSRFSTPDSCSSIGAATVRVSVSLEAPGYVAVMITVGGAISGYCATGKPRTAIRPAMTIVMEMTAAKIGRLMKNLERFMSRPCRQTG